MSRLGGGVRGSIQKQIQFRLQKNKKYLFQQHNRTERNRTLGTKKTRKQEPEVKVTNHHKGR